MSIKYYSISKEAGEAAVAATSFDIVEPTEGCGVPFKVQSGGNPPREFKRWSEPLKVVRTHAEPQEFTNKESGEKRPVTTFYLALQGRATSILNKGRFFHARHSINFATLLGQSTEDKGSNDRSIKALITLFDACGTKLPGGEITDAILQVAFPEKGGPGNSILAGKEFTAVVCASPRTDGKEGRKINVEEYAPKA